MSDYRIALLDRISRLYGPTHSITVSFAYLLDYLQEGEINDRELTIMCDALEAEWGK